MSTRNAPDIRARRAGRITLPNGLDGSVRHRFFYVHYAQAPIVGDWVLPWDELPVNLQGTAGHRARVHEMRFRDQWRSDCVYVHELLVGSLVLNIGTVYSGPDAWIYEVEPTLPLERGPERGGHLATSRICPRARVIRRLHEPLVNASTVILRKSADGAGTPPA
jgi:hypothetical protein